jgi:hypothetical protein
MSTLLSRTLLVLLPLALGACSAVDEDGEDDDLEATDAEDGFAEADISVAGRWVLPASVRAAGASSRAAFNSAGPWRGTRGCSGSYLAGTRELAASVKRQFRQVLRTEGYNCRQVRGGSSMSMHGTGRAVDIFFPLSRRAADNTKGDPVANYLVTNSSKLGIQYVIWDRTEWKVGVGASSYGGQHPHHDHIHVEMNIAAANNRAPYF